MDHQGTPVMAESLQTPRFEPTPEPRAPERAAEPASERMPEPAPAPVYSAPPPMPAPAPAAPAVDVERALKDSGLVQVQTRADVKAELPPEPEFRPAKRERRPPPTDLSTAMQQVETGK